MATTTDNLDDSPEHIKKLRAEAEQAKVLAKELEQKERQIAFLQAGIDTGSKLGQMMMKTYEGELMPEAIRSEAVELGLVKAEDSEQEQGVDERQTQFQNARDTFAGGDSARRDPEVKPAADRAFDEWNEGRRMGLSNADAQDNAFAAFIAAAAQGDPTARFDESAWRAKSTAAGHLG